MKRSGCVVLITKRGDERLYGTVELSFSLDVRENEAFLYWDVPNSKEESIAWANRYIEMWRKTHPDWKFEIWDVDNPTIPIVVDWRKHEEALQPAKTLSGVKDKYHARNLSFHRKNGHEMANSVAKSLEVT